MSANMFSLAGKRALVTGASRGIGAAIATAFAEAGADVALAARSEVDLDEVAAGVRGMGGAAIRCDVTKPDEVAACVQRAERRSAALMCGLRVEVLVLEPGTLSRSEGKAKRVVDRRTSA